MESSQLLLITVIVLFAVINYIASHRCRRFTSVRNRERVELKPLVDALTVAYGLDLGIRLQCPASRPYTAFNRFHAKFSLEHGFAFTSDNPGLSII